MTGVTAGGAVLI